MNIQNLNNDHLRVIANYLPINTAGIISLVDKKCNAQMSELLANSSNILHDFIACVYEKSSDTEQAQLFLQRFAAKPYQTEYGLVIHATKYKENVLQVIAKTFPNLVKCTYIRPQYMTPNDHFGSCLSRKFYHVTTNLFLLYAFPFVICNTVAENSEKNTISRSIASHFTSLSAFQSANAALVMEYPLCSLSSLFDETMKELFINIQIGGDREIGYEMSALPSFKKLEKIKIYSAGVSPVEIDYENLHARIFKNTHLDVPCGAQFFSQYKNLTSLSVLLNTSFNTYYQETIQGVIKEYFPAGLKHLSMPMIGYQSYYPIQPRSDNETLSAIMSHCTGLNSLCIRDKNQLFLSIPQEPYTSLEVLDIDDQGLGGENLFTIVPNLCELTIHYWNPATSSITFDKAPSTLKKVIIIFPEIHKQDVQNRLAGKGFEVVV